MEYRTIGKTGIKASVIGLGSEGIARISGEETGRLIGFAIDRGVNIIHSQIEDISFLPAERNIPDTESRTNRFPRERYSGTYTGRTLPNDLLNNGVYDNMGCCVGAGARALCLLWCHAMHKNEHGTWIDLWLSCDHESFSLRISDDTLTVFTKEPCLNLFVRVPGWLKDNLASVELSIGNQKTEKSATLVDGYLSIKNVPAESVLKIRFPGVDIKQKWVFCGEEYQIVWRQNRVFDVLPRGKYIPLYKGK